MTKQINIQIVKTAISGVALTATLGIFASSASALTLASSSGTWSNVVGGGGVVYNVTPSDALPGEKQVRWGDPSAPVTARSGLGFTGVGLTNFNTDQIFEVGTLRHFNNPIPRSTAVSAVDLGITLDFSTPSVNQSFNFNFLVDETPNTPPCKYPGATICPDKISFSNAVSSNSFQIDGVDYTLELLGFSNTPGGTPVNEFISEEDRTNSTKLFAKITTKSVPEPASLAGLGLLGIYFVARRQSQKVKASSVDLSN